jgi:hypothetical protein
MSGLLLIPFIAIVYEDFKYRAIHWWWVASIAVLGFGLGKVSLKILFLNTGFIVVQLLMVSVYFSMKNRKFINITHNFLGWGDILFFLSMAFWLSPLDFIHFNLYALLFTLIGFIIVNNITHTPIITVPLAGWMSIFGIIYFALDWFIGYNILEKWRLI